MWLKLLCKKVQPQRGGDRRVEKEIKPMSDTPATESAKEDSGRFVTSHVYLPSGPDASAIF